MNVIHVTESITSRGGGIATSVLGLANSERREGIRGPVHALLDDGAPIPMEVPIALRRHPVHEKLLMRRSREMGPALTWEEADLFHSHGLWAAPSIVVPRVARRRNLPWIVSPHGMLEPWALGQGRWKKRIAFRLFENRHLEGASCLRALCLAEAESIRSLGFEQPIAVIPNGVELPRISENGSEGPRKTMLFLGRIHPKKGLEQAIQAWARLHRSGLLSGWRFVIAGWDEDGHRSRLERLCRSQGLQDSLTFTGPVFGDEKERLFREADAFILPSFSEGLPMAVLEAWSNALPVIMTEACHLEEGFDANAALLVQPEEASLAAGIEAMLSLEETARIEMGRRGRRLVERSYSWKAVTAEMTSVYDWVVGRSAQPDCVLVGTP